MTNRNEQSGKRKKEKAKKGGERITMARTYKNGPDRILFNSVMTAHMPSRSDRVVLQKHCDVYIALGDETKVHTGKKGTRKVTWKTQDGGRSVSLSDTLVSKKLYISILSVPVLVKRDIATLFLPLKALSY